MNLNDNLQEATILALEGKLHIKPRTEDDKSDRDTIEYFKNEILNNRHEPILIDDNGNVIDGNHRMVAYKELGLEPPLLYAGNRADFFNLVKEYNYDGISTIKAMIQNGTAVKL